MIATEQEYAVTRERAAQFAARLGRLQAHPGADTAYRMRLAATQGQLAALQRELAMWDAGIREPVSFPLLATATLPGLDLSEEQYEALPPEERACYRQRLAIAAKQLQINAIDEHIGIALDRIADWRRHRAWLSREIADLQPESEAPEPQTAATR